MKNVHHCLILLIVSAVLPVVGVSCSSAQSPPVSHTSCLAYSKISTGAASDGWLDCFVYDAAPPFRLDACIHLDSLPESLEMGSTSGKKILVALARCDPKLLTYDKIISFESICSALLDIASEDPERPVMSGVCSIDAGNCTDAPILMKPALCKIVLEKVDIDLSERPYAGKTMEIVRVFLLNVSGICPVVPGRDTLMREVINYGRFDSTGTHRLSHPQMLYSEKVDGAQMFCFPSRGESGMLGSCRTKLVVETNMDGVTYYYPVEIKDMQRGVQYSYSMRITRTGSLDPDTPAVVGAMAVECHMKDWEEYDEDVEDY